MNKNDGKNWLKEYAEFTNADITGVTVPAGVFENLRKRIFPSPWKVFGKVFSIHVVVGFLSLGICHQFGLNPFQTEYSLMNFFMKFGGHSFCMVLCGVLFMTTSLWLANFFLALEELEAIRRYQWLQLGVISLASLAAFYFFGAEMVATFVGLWIVGAFVGGFLAIETSYRIRAAA